MNESESYVVKEIIFDNSLVSTIDSIRNSCFRDCYYKYYHTFVCKIDFDIQLTNIEIIEIINITISDKNKNLYELNKKLTFARQNGFNFNQINKLTMKFFLISDI